MNDRFIKKLWHTNRKIFLEEFSILQTIHSDGTVEHTYFEYKPKTQELERLSSCQIKEINCTGLKDKHGKLIYEGDVVTYGWLTPISKVWRTDGKHIVEWQNGFTVIGNIAGYDVEHGKTRNIVVIGNIYENADLLESED